MKPPRFLIIFLLLNCSFIICHAQGGTWTWMSGDSSINSVGVLGAQGVPSPGIAPGGRYACAFWTDLAGNFWIFGGVAYQQNPNFNTITMSDDLWKFDPQTLEWTFMRGQTDEGIPQRIAAPKGVYDSLNTPGGRGWGIFTWVTPDNHLWLFGGSDEFAFPPFNADLWQYDPSINQWAWMGTGGLKPPQFGPHYGTMGVGDSTTGPGIRSESNSAWTDNNGNLWLFGGEVPGDSGTAATLNDMWEYNVSTGIWTWMSGTDNIDDTGHYGTIGQASVNNYPAARVTNFFWKDGLGNFWLGGGGRFDADIMMQDIWKFNPATLEWTWVSGQQGNDRSQQGSNCTSDTLNKAGARYENRAVCTICDDLAVTYSGGNYHVFADTLQDEIMVNDMWAYQPSLNQWTKINEWDSTANYGTYQITSSGAYPNARLGSAGFKDGHNNLWMFGGSLTTPGGQFEGFYNDLWMYVPDTTCTQNFSCSRSCNLAPPLISTNDTIFCASDSTQLCAPAGFNSYQWNANVTGMCMEAAAAGDYYVTVTDISGCTAESNHLSISVYPVTPVSITQHGDTLSSFGAVNYQWLLDNNPLNGATSPLYIAKQQGSYSIQITDTNGCTAISEPVSITGIDNLSEEPNISIYPNPCSVASVQLSVGSEFIGSELQIFDDEGRIVFHSEISNQKSAITIGELAAGVYYLRISSANVSIVRKLVKL